MSLENSGNFFLYFWASTNEWEVPESLDPATISLYFSSKDLNSIDSFHIFQRRPMSGKCRSGTCLELLYYMSLLKIYFPSKVFLILSVANEWEVPDNLEAATNYFIICLFWIFKIPATVFRLSASSNDGEVQICWNLPPNTLLHVSSEYLNSFQGFSNSQRRPMSGKCLSRALRLQLTIFHYMSLLNIRSLSTFFHIFQRLQMSEKCHQAWSLFKLPH